MKKMLLLGSHGIIHLFFSFLLQITTLFHFFYVHNYIIFSSHLAQLPRYGIGPAMLVEKNLHWLEKGFGGKHGSKHVEPRKRGTDEAKAGSRNVVLRAQLPSADTDNEDIDSAPWGWRAEGREYGAQRRSI